MKRNYDDWLVLASEHKRKLDKAISDGNAKEIIYYRGKYLWVLKQAYKLDPDGIIPSSVTKYGYDVELEEEIKVQLENHKNQIDVSLQANKRESSIKGHTLSTELGLKLRRLSTRASQISFATDAAERTEAIKNTAKETASVIGTVAKAPVMVAAKVTSAIGPLAITIMALPAKAFASLLSITIDLFNGRAPESETYNNTIVDQVSDALKDGIKSLSKTTYESFGRI